MNFMTVEVVVEHILIASKEEQKQIRTMLVRIDFHNGDVLDFFKHLAKAIAK
jgi:tRNA pseudouridine-54 N-methylase